MEQGDNAGNDDLPQLRANFNETTQALFLNMKASSKAFLEAHAKMHFAALALSKALLRAVPKVGMELGEAYTLEAGALPANASFLFCSLNEFRKRNGIND